MTADTIKPKVGMGATYVIGSDRYPYEIIEVSKSGKAIWIRSMSTKPNADHGGIYGRQSYDYFSNPNGKIIKATLRKNGKFIIEGNTIRSRCGQIVIGYADYYQDPHFQERLKNG